MASGGAGRYAPVGALFLGRSVLITLAVLVVLFIAYTLAGFFLVPRLIVIYVPRYVEQQLKRTAEIGEVRVNPSLLTVEIKNFRRPEAAGRPLLGSDRLFIHLDLANRIVR